MRKLRLLFLVGLASCFISEKLMVSAQASFSTDDIYLEGRPSGDIPVDDEDDKDGGSGSGSGDYYPTDEEIPRRLNWSDTTSPTYKEVIPTRATQTTAADSQDQTTTVKPSPYIPYSTNREQEVPGDILPDSTSQMPFRKTTEAKSNMDNSPEDSVVVVVVDEDEIVQKDGRGGLLQELDVPEQVSTENMWERTDVLAAVIACGVVGFLCAVSLLLLLAYRMKKKDEGSYELGDTKLSTTAYQKAPTKEFYA